MEYFRNTPSILRCYVGRVFHILYKIQNVIKPRSVNQFRRELLGWRISSFGLALDQISVRSAK